MSEDQIEILLATQSEMTGTSNKFHALHKSLFDEANDAIPDRDKMAEIVKKINRVCEDEMQYAEKILRLLRHVILPSDRRKRSELKNS